MADDQNKNNNKDQNGGNKSSEADASDLLSLWGTGSSSSAGKAEKAEEKSESKAPDETFAKDEPPAKKDFFDAVAEVQKGEVQKVQQQPGPEPESKPEPGIAPMEPSSEPVREPEPVSEPAWAQVPEPSPPQPPPQEPAPEPTPTEPVEPSFVEPEAAVGDEEPSIFPEEEEKEQIDDYEKIRKEKDQRAPDKDAGTPWAEMVEQTTPRQEEKISEETTEEELPRKKDSKERERKDELTEGEIITPKGFEEIPEPGAEPEGAEGGSQLDEFLEELNLSRKHIYLGIGCIVLVIVLIVGGIYGLKFLRNGQPEQPEPNKEEPLPAVTKDETGISSSSSIGGTIAVTENSVADSGLRASVSIGLEAEAKTELAEYIMVFRRMQNAYQTDVDEMLNRATDRRARLQSYLALLKSLHEEGSAKLQRLIEARELIRIENDSKREQQEIDDANFFEQVEALNAQTAQEILNKFIEISKDIVDLRARFKALQKVQTFYEQALPRISSRIRSIELNEEPLVSGIKVYEIRGADLNLIVPVNNGQQQSLGATRLQDAEESSFPSILPTHPSQIRSEHDYVTQPGGGFDNGTSVQRPSY